MSNLSAIVLAHNSQEVISRCLESLAFCDEVIVIDDNSTDRTSHIATNAGARVIVHSLNNNFASQRNFGLSQAKSNWVLFIDADEIITPQLAQNIKSSIGQNSITGFYLRRSDVMWDKRLGYGDLRNVWLLRLGLKNSGTWVGQVHEVWRVAGATGKIEGELIHYPHHSISEFLTSLNWYSSLRAEELHQLQVGRSLVQVVFYPIFKFIYLWIFKLGFLDGTPGFIHAMLMGFYSFLVRGKLYLLPKHNKSS